MNDNSPKTPRQTEILKIAGYLHDNAYYRYLSFRNLCYDIRDGQYKDAAEKAKHLNLALTHPDFYAELQTLANQSTNS